MVFFGGWGRGRRGVREGGKSSHERPAAAAAAELAEASFFLFFSFLRNSLSFRLSLSLTCAVSAQRRSCEMMSALGMNAGISIDEISLPSLVAAAAMVELLDEEDEDERPLRALRAAGADADTLGEADPRRRRAEGLGEARAATGREDDEAEAEEATAFVVKDVDRQRMILLKKIGWRRAFLLAFTWWRA